MTARLPIPGQDDGTWGSILNTFLEVSHNSDGSISGSAIQQAGGVTEVNSKGPSDGSITLSASDVGAIPQSGGTITGNLTVNGHLNTTNNILDDGTGNATLTGNLSAANIMTKVAGTAAGGFVLQNATPTIVSWAVPNDGQIHRFLVFSTLSVIEDEGGGGEIDIEFTAPDGTASGGGYFIYPGIEGEGIYTQDSPYNLLVQAGSIVSVVQASPMTVGSATLWVELWAL